MLYCIVHNFLFQKSKKGNERIEEGQNGKVPFQRNHCPIRAVIAIHDKIAALLIF
jgi:hypothetical protein